MVSVCIITYNRPDDLLALLYNIATWEYKETHLREVLVLDNASVRNYDRVRAFAQDFPACKIRYIQNACNEGVSRGRNRVGQLATGKYLFFLDDDCECRDREVLLKIHDMFAEPFAQEHQVAVFTLRIFHYDTNDFQRNLFPHKHFHKRKHMAQFVTYYFGGAAHVTLRDAFLLTGGYPPDFLYGMEEYDLSFRLLAAGFSVAYDARVKVLHKESAHGRHPNTQKQAMMWVNKSKVAFKYLPLRYVCTTVCLWAMLFLYRSPFSVGLWLATVWKILCFFRIHRNDRKNNLLAPDVLESLRQMNARLWY